MGFTRAYDCAPLDLQKVIYPWFGVYEFGASRGLGDLGDKLTAEIRDNFA